MAQTAGPWRIDGPLEVGSETDGWNIVGKVGKSLLMSDDPGVCGMVTSKEDAALMAAAPDLLAALETIATTIVPTGNDGDGSDLDRARQVLTTARAAIAKAKGGA